MVRQIDENWSDHVGFLLWDAAAAWKEEFVSEMISAGYVWYGDACASIVPFIGEEGAKQSKIVERIGVSKQAVQQHVLELERLKIVARKPDPTDGRAKVVFFTELGRQSQIDGARIKKKIDDRYRQQIGDVDFDFLVSALRRLKKPSGANRGAGPAEVAYISYNV